MCGWVPVGRLRVTPKIWAWPTRGIVVLLSQKTTRQEWHRFREKDKFSGPKDYRWDGCVTRGDLHRVCRAQGTGIYETCKERGILCVWYQTQLFLRRISKAVATPSDWESVPSWRCNSGIRTSIIEFVRLYLTFEDSCSGGQRARSICWTIFFSLGNIVE